MSELAKNAEVMKACIYCVVALYTSNNQAMASQQDDDDRRPAHQLKLAVSSDDVETARRLIEGGIDYNDTSWVSRNLSDFAQRLSVQTFSLLSLLSLTSKSTTS